MTNTELLEHSRVCCFASVVVTTAMLVTCRCYELRCQTGVVAGNYSSGNTLIPYAIAPSELKPVYQFQTVSNELPADSFGRIFPGNVLNSSQLLFTDCWNTTDSLVWSTISPFPRFLNSIKHVGWCWGTEWSKVCQAVQHTCIHTGKHGLQDCPACSTFITWLQASGQGPPPGLLQHGIAVHQH